MPRLSQYIPAPLQGTSQAAPQVRLKDQAEDLFNCLVEVPDGWRKMPPMVYRHRLTPTTGFGTDFHRTLIPSTNRGEPDTYLFIAASGVASLKNANTGADIALTVSSEAQDYLDEVVSPVDDIRTVTVEDYTFIANRKVPLTLDSGTAATRPYEAIVWVKLSDYSRKYVLNIAGIVATYVTPEGNDPDDADDIDTSVILDRILNGGTPTPNGTLDPIGGIGASLTSAGFTWTLRGSLLFLSRAANYTITIDDGLGGTAMAALKGSTPRISDLPVVAPDGFTIRIEGASGQSNDDYFVRFLSTGVGGGGNTGVWKETIQPGAPYGLDPESLPMGLRYDQGTSTWSLDVLPWGQRETGNEELCPDPLTPGDFVMDIGWFRSRLRFITSGAVLYAGASNPFRLYPATLTTLLDSDPIQLINPGAVRSFFTSGATFDQRDVIFGEGSQAVVSSEGPFTLKTARIDLLSDYPFNGALPLIPAGDNVHFTMVKGDQFDGLWELSINGPLQRTQGEDLTVAVPRYLPAGMNRWGRLKGSYATLYGKSGEPNVYLHLYRYVGQERVQSGFFRWGLPSEWMLGDIVSGQNDTKLRIGLVHRNSGRLHDVEIDLAPQLKDSPTSNILTTLHIRLTEAQVNTLTYDPVLDRTRIGHDFLNLDQCSVSIRGDGQALPEGFLGYKVGTVSDDLYVQGDWTGLQFYVGLPYEARWSVSQIFHWGQDQKPMYDGGLLNLRHAVIDLGPSAFMGASVQVGLRDPRSYETPETDFNLPSLFSGPWTVTLAGDAKDTRFTITNGSHLQGTVLGFTWVGEHNLRSQSQG